MGLPPLHMTNSTPDIKTFVSIEIQERDTKNRSRSRSVLRIESNHSLFDPGLTPDPNKNSRYARMVGLQGSKNLGSFGHESLAGSPTS